MKKSHLAGGILALAFLSTAGMAREFSVGLTAGTIGIGAEAATSITENLNVRTVVAGFKYSKDGSQGTDITYEGDAKFLNAGLLLDYYPFGSGIRLSAGGYYNGTSVALKGIPTAGSSYTFNDVTYTSADVGDLNAEVKYKKIMPYVGFGFGNTMAGGNFTFGMDIGAMIGSPTASLTVTNPTNNATLAANAAIEEQKLKDEIGDLPVYPVVTISASYRF